MTRKRRHLVCDDHSQRRTSPDTESNLPLDSETTRVDTVPAALRFAEESSLSGVGQPPGPRELPMYAGVSPMSSRRNDATVPDAPLGRGSPVAIRAAGETVRCEPLPAPPSGTRNRIPPPPPSAPLPSPSA